MQVHVNCARAHATWSALILIVRIIIARCSQDLEQTWCEGNLEELKRFLQDAVFSGEYVPAGVLEIDVIPSEEVFNSFCDHYGFVRTGGNNNGKCPMLS